MARPVEFDHHQGTYRLTEPIGSLPLVSLNQGELVAIYFAEKVLRQYRGTPFEPDLASAFSKMQQPGRWIRERKWHRSARIQEELDGGLVLRLRVAETSGLRRWVLQFGSQAEVLAPASLRRAVGEELSGAAAAYRRRSYGKTMR